MIYKHSTITLCQLICILILAISCTSEVEQPILERITMDNITIPKGFVIEELYKPGNHDQGSWVSVTKDDKGRLYTSDQYGNIYRVTLPDAVNKLDKVDVEKLDLTIGLAQGLLWHKGELYALVNSNDKRDLMIHSGLYKITDSTGDGEFDNVKMLRSFEGQGEHGPHNVILSPDGQFLYLVLGNHTDIPKDLKSVVPKVWDEDNLIPVIKDPSGHANTRKAPGGWLVKTDFEGKEWTLMSVGMRNTYDIAFNPDGELFGFDSDMEYDLGMPWYRPIRLTHITSGSEFGWRTGTGKFSAEYPDNLPGIGNLGQGSPTGLLEGKGLKFPSYYQKGFYLFDWSYGTMYYASLKPEGSSYTTEITEFVSGIPLPLTNGIAGDDGSMYFLTGGRRLESALYKLTYTGEQSSVIQNLEENSEGKNERKLRKELEALHGRKASDKIDFIIKNLDHEDRFTRFSARVAMEHQDYDLWKNEISKSATPLKTITLSLSIARHGDDADRKKALNTLLDIDWTSLIESQKIDFVRAVDLLLIRSEAEISDQLKRRVEDAFLPTYLTGSDLLNKEVCGLLSYLQVADIIAPTIEKMETDTATSNLKSIYLSGDISKRSDQYGNDVENMLKNMPNQQNISYAKSLSVINEGWTTGLREKYFRWYNRALKKSGGRQYSNFIKAIQKIALANVPVDDQQYFEALASESMNQTINSMQSVKQPKGPGQNWTVETVKSAFSKNQVNVNFENGRNFFKASLCATCHSVNGEGGNSGPELTKVGTRFSISNMAEAIVDPSATVSDRYRNTSYTMKNGNVVTGRIIEETEKELELSTNAFSPDLTTKIRKDRIVKEEESTVSSMPPGLINRLNEQELSDLITFLVSGGDKNNQLYKSK
jgi:putative heme-binding domain-containing protein